MFVQIVDDVRAYLAERNIEALVVEGKEARRGQPDFAVSPDGRIAFVPISPIEIAEPQFIGDEPRQLWNTTFLFDVSFAGYDAANPERDLCHRRHCYGLWEAAAQVLQRSYSGSHRWLGARWEDDRVHGRYGAELIATLAIAVPLFDVTGTPATPAPLPGAPKPVPPPATP